MKIDMDVTVGEAVETIKKLSKSIHVFFFLVARTAIGHLANRLILLVRLEGNKRGAFGAELTDGPASFLF